MKPSMKNDDRLLKRKIATVFLLLLVVMATASTVTRVQYSRDLRKLAASYGFAPPSVSGRLVALSSSFTKMIFEVDSRKLYFNGALIWMNGTLAKAGSGWMLIDQDLRNVVDPLLRPDSALAGEKGGVVVLDAGHGGLDQGAAGRSNALEKKIAMDIVKRVAAKLHDADVPVRMTRSGDSFLSLSERCSNAERMGAGVFVSVHINHADSVAVSGLETYIITPPGCSGTVSKRPDYRTYSGNRHDAANMILGYYVHKGLLSCTKAIDRGIKRARFQVLRDINCPAVLAECGFLSNSREEAMLVDPRYRDVIADGISRGITTYLRSLAKSSDNGLDRAARADTVTARNQTP